MQGRTTPEPTDEVSPERGPSQLYRWRFAIDLLCLALLLTLGGVQRLRMVPFWFVSQCVFPYPVLAQSLRARPDRNVMLIVGGVALIGLMLFKRRVGDNLGILFFALEGVLIGFWQVAFLKREPLAPIPVGSLLLGGAALACGLAWVLLPA